MLDRIRSKKIVLTLVLVGKNYQMLVQIDPTKLKELINQLLKLNQIGCVEKTRVKSFTDEVFR